MTYYITTPLYYVNDLPHIGSAYPTIAADFIAGHMIQRGEDVCFLTGTDEHGQKIEKAAAANNKSPQQHCDYIAEEFKKLWGLLDIQYDKFRRTSAEDHKSFVAEFWTKVEVNGDIYKANYEGLYCVSCEDFKLEKDLDKVGEELHCPVHKQRVENYAQENYFFKLSKYEAKLREHIEKNPDFIYPENRRNEVLGWIKEGLRDFPISRCNIEWGIAVPADTSSLRASHAALAAGSGEAIPSGQQKIYVWFDALLGYISGLGSERHQYWASGGQITHIIGKDILRFHAVYWPAMLMSAGYALPTKVFGHGFLTKDGMKMGKTLGNVIDPVALVNSFGSDAVRFYFLREIIFGKDGDFTQDGFVQRLNADLANNLGNLVNRTLNLINKYYSGLAPSMGIASPTSWARNDSASSSRATEGSVAIQFADLSNKLSNLGPSFSQAIDRLDPHQALELLFFALNDVNQLLSEIAPWKLLKEDASNQLAAASLALSLDACRRAAILLAPLTPSISRKIFEQMGLIASDDKRSRKELLQEIFSLKQLDSQPDYKIVPELSPVFLRLEMAAVK